MENPQPALSDLERLKFENLNLKKYALELQLHQILRERVELVKAIEEMHPGWRWTELQGFMPVAGDPNGRPPQ